MIIQKLRLEHGWSQQQLAEMSGLSVRTIQRIENGKSPSVESIKALAAVFDIDFPTLRGALTMNDGTDDLPTEINTQPTSDLQLSEQEKQAYKQVRKLRKFYKDLLIFALIIV
ncbi:MAG: XRE family transcriptional regulator, partial [Gammaproteobacteria bacterium]